MATRKNIDPPPAQQGTPAHRLDELEARVTALEGSARTTEASTGGTASGVSVAPSNEYTNGMTQPDALGRVKLQRIEELRLRDGGRFTRANAELPRYAYVKASVTTFNVNDTQRDHILMNTGENAIMRQGRAIKVVKDEGGKYHEGDTMLDTISTYEQSPDGAAEEIVRKYEALAAGTASPTNFSPG